MLKKQDGFRGELSLVNPENHALGISMWDTEKNAERYRTDVATFTVATSTIG